MVSNMFGIFTPKNLGRWTHFDEHIFEMSGSTTNQSLLQVAALAEKLHVHLGALHLSWGSGPPFVQFISFLSCTVRNRLSFLFEIVEVDNIGTLISVWRICFFVCYQKCCLTSGFPNLIFRSHQQVVKPGIKRPNGGANVSFHDLNH